MAEMTIATVTPGDKVGRVTFTVDPQKVCKFWSSAPFAKDLVPGATAEATFETVASKNPQYPDDKFIKTWGGVGGKPAGRVGGGGGGGRPQRSESECLSIMAQTALGRAVDAHAGRSIGEKPVDVQGICNAAEVFMAKLVDLVQKHKGALEK